jgi:hypothetical protein
MTEPTDDDPAPVAALEPPDPGPALVASLMSAAKEYAGMDILFRPGTGYDTAPMSIVHARRLKEAASAVIDEDERLFRKMLADHAAKWEAAEPQTG